jgi:hypothetical protein
VEYKEYLRSEVPAELQEVLNSLPEFMTEVVTAPLPEGGNDSFGFTYQGVCYRIYRNEPGAELRAACVVKDAEKGAAIPAEQIKAAMDTLGMGAEKQTEFLAVLCRTKRSTRTYPHLHNMRYSDANL